MRHSRVILATRFVHDDRERARGDVHVFAVGDCSSTPHRLNIEHALIDARVTPVSVPNQFHFP